MFLLGSSRWCAIWETNIDLCYLCATVRAGIDEREGNIEEGILKSRIASDISAFRVLRVGKMAVVFKLETMRFGKLKFV
jgi:hypothetical protein